MACGGWGAFHPSPVTFDLHNLRLVRVDLVTTNMDMYVCAQQMSRTTTCACLAGLFFFLSETYRRNFESHIGDCQYVGNETEWGSHQKRVNQASALNVPYGRFLRKQVRGTLYQVLILSCT